ncbi:MAG: hypothetical protein OEV08_08545 [Nitrospira sp.]|nr:hypothetical protein [Nitrospira sp.]
MIVACIVQGATWAYAEEPTSSTSLVSHSKQLASAAVLKPLDGLIGLGVGTVGGAMVGGYLVPMIATANILPNRCVAHAGFGVSIRGGALCYAAGVPLFVVTVPVGLATGAITGASLGTWHGLTHGYIREAIKNHE